MKQLVYQVCYTRYQVPFYLWQTGPVLKQVQKYYDRDYSDSSRGCFYGPGCRVKFSERDYLVEVIIPYENSIQILNDQVREKVSKYELQRNHIPWRFSVSRTLVLYLHAYT